jgi:hypothetical protein
VATGPGGAIRKLGIEEEDYIGAAAYFVHNQLNGLLRSLGSPFLWWDKDSNVSHMTFRIGSLWTAMCFQFARAVAENRLYQSCQSCFRWFELAPGVNRADKQFCTDACRQRWHRKMRAESKEMRAKGKSNEAIASALDVTMDQVMHWLKQKGE